MKLTKQLYFFIILTLISVVCGMYFTITGTASEVVCYEQIFGHMMSFKVFEKILSWSFFLGLFLMTATRAKVNVLLCLIFLLLMIIPVLIWARIYFCAS